MGDTGETPVLSVCVIGAGAAGLCAVKHLLEYNRRERPEVKISPTVFEKSQTVGGLWNYEEGDNPHSSIYRGLKTNLPKVPDS